MINFIKDNILNSETEALVNTVNTEGVMGKGIALQIKEQYPLNFKFYKEACSKGKVVTGKMLVFETGELINPRYIINFPTKEQWRNSSKIEYIEKGLEDLKKVIQQYCISSIAIPPLGCGNGKLNWSDVKPLIVNALKDIPGLNTYLYEPSEKAYNESVNTKIKKTENLTPIRAIILSLYEKYVLLNFDITYLEAQKLPYFTQRFGENLKLNYRKQQFGPYSRELDYLLHALDGIYLNGMKYRTARPFDQLNLVNEKLPDIKKFADDNLNTKQKEILSKVMNLIEGFESPIGLELLATVDYIIKTNNTINADIILKEIEKWSDEEKWNERKKNLLKKDFVELAYKRLMDYEDDLYHNNIFN